MSSSNSSSSSSWHRDASERRRRAGEALEPGTLAPEVPRGTEMPRGFHHVALVCRDMRTTVAWWERALGFKLRAILPMHGCEDAKHCFLEAGNGCELSFIEFGTPRDGVPGVTFPDGDLADAPVRALHHFAFAAESLQELRALRNQVKAAGTRPSKIIDHGFCHSFYTRDPNGYQVEVTATYRPYDKRDCDLTLLSRKPSKEECHFEAQLLDSRSLKATGALRANL